jgi:hypothetical protein
VWQPAQSLVLAGCAAVQLVVDVWQLLHAAEYDPAVPCVGV